MPAEVDQRLRPGVLGRFAIVTGNSIPEEPMPRARIDVHGGIGYLCLERPFDLANVLDGRALDPLTAALR